jgi:hypothetical protein
MFNSLNNDALFEVSSIVNQLPQNTRRDACRSYIAPYISEMDISDRENKPEVRQLCYRIGELDKWADLMALNPNDEKIRIANREEYNRLRFTPRDRTAWTGLYEKVKKEILHDDGDEGDEPDERGES